MGLLKDIKQEWTWEGIKADWKEHWPDFIAIVLAAGLTPAIQQLGWGENEWVILGVWGVIALTTAVVIALIRRTVKKLNK